MKFAFSLPGMTIWVFALDLPLCIFVFGYKPTDALVSSSIMSVILAVVTTRRMKKDNPGFFKALDENRGAQLRKFKRYVRSGQLPPDPSELSQFAEYLYGKENSLKRSSPTQEKCILGFFVLMGTVFAASQEYRVSLLVLIFIVMSYESMRVSSRNRKTIPELQERLHQQGVPL
jgi:hypothetical protein